MKSQTPISKRGPEENEADFGFGTLERPQEIQKILLLVRLKPIEKSPHHHIGLGPSAPVFLDCPLQIAGSAVMKEEDTLP